MAARFTLDKSRADNFWSVDGNHSCLLDGEAFFGRPYTIPTNEEGTEVEGSVFCSPSCALKWVLMCNDYPTHYLCWFSHFYLKHYGLANIVPSPHPKLLKKNRGPYEIGAYRALGKANVLTVLTEPDVYPFGISATAVNHTSFPDQLIKAISSEDPLPSA